MDEDLYDEFGNYIGPEIEDSDDEEDNLDIGDEFGDAMDFESEHPGTGGQVVAADHYDSAARTGGTPAENRIVLHEDKKYYPEADEVYPGVKTVLLDEDAQDLSEPIIKPIKSKHFAAGKVGQETPALKYSAEFLATLMNTPTLVRNIAIVGHIHHGKTVFVDTLVQATQETAWDPTKELRYTDTRVDEQERLLSVKASAVSLVLENLKGKSYLVNLLDCPGHVNFSDECTAALRAADGAVIVVDAVEGVMMSTERLIKHALQARLPISVVSVGRKTCAFIFVLEVAWLCFHFI
jgi:116 kDa U5 small nuclear ribonucleoprotein component